MKKIIYIIGLFAAFLFSAELMAQDAIVMRNGTNFEVSLDAGDTISNNSTTLSKVIGVGNKLSVQLYSIQVSLDSISGTPTEAWVLAGSMDNVNWTTITTFFPFFYITQCAGFPFFFFIYSNPFLFNTLD